MNDQPTHQLIVVGANMLARQLEEYVADIKKTIENKIEVTYCDIEDEVGSALAERYEIEASELPTIMILEDDESIYKEWRGEDKPDAETIAYEVGLLTGN
jgi:hypothetical protein